MKNNGTTAVIGAGPYGLSVAAHLKAGGIPTLVFGKTMELWQKMPPQMFLKSIWTASSISDPAGKYSLDRYIAANNIPHQEPIPQPLFLNYAFWFQQHAVPDVDSTYVQCVRASKGGFHLDLADGRTVETSRVVVASGISSFVRIPDFARNLPETLVAHTSAQKDLTLFKERNVIVVGNGQSALEYAAMLHEAGAKVELIARNVVRWHTKILYDHTGPAKHIFYPPGDVGPPGINWLVAFPTIYSRFPDKIKHPVHKRAVRPGGAKWLRPRIAGQIRITENTQIVKASAQGESLRLELSDGTKREVDYMFLGTGYQPDIHKLTFIDTALFQQIQVNNGYPVLNRRFETSVPRLYFAGILAGRTFGPTCHFVSGTKALAQQIAHHAARDE